MSSIFDFVSQHSGVVGLSAGMIGMGVIDLLYAINPNLKANGALHYLYLLSSGGKEPS